MASIDRRASTTTRQWTFQSQYAGKQILSADVQYPHIGLRNKRAAQRINEQIQHEVDRFALHILQDMEKDAARDYEYSLANQFPVHMYEAVMHYMVTLNEGCALSMHTDQYQYTGGAHGMTLRTSATWDLADGSAIRLRDLFPAGTNSRQAALTAILAQADKRANENPTLFFDNYRELIAASFNPDSFYLTPDSVVFYFGEYEIGPYASGIIEFEIPYKTLGAKKPDCTSAAKSDRR